MDKQMVSFKKQLTAKEKSDTILSFIKTLNNESNNRNMIHIIEELVKALLTASYARLWILDKEKSILYSKTINESEDIEIPIYQGLLGKVARREEPFYINDIESNSEYIKSIDNFEENNLKDMILMPIIKDKDVIYVIQAMTSKYDIQQFTDNDLQTFKMIIPYIQSINLDSTQKTEDEIKSDTKDKYQNLEETIDGGILSKVFTLFK